MPAPLETAVGNAEDVATAIVAPLASIALDKADELLAAVDARASTLLAAHEANVAGSFASAKAAAFGAVERAVSMLRAALDPATYAALPAALGRRLALYADPDAAVAAASAAYGRVAARPPVATVLHAADPLIAAGQEGYARAHGAIVMQPLYRSLYDTAASLPAKVADTPLYKAGYPLVAPVADPVIGKLARSQVLRQLEDHLKPKAA